MAWATPARNPLPDRLAHKPLGSLPLGPLLFPSQPMHSTPSTPSTPSADAQARADLDDALSNRFIALDPQGYFLIFIDRETQEICADHYSNDVNDQGLATDPQTGEVLSCKGDLQRSPTARFRGRTAKELGMKITEQAEPCPLTRLDHALYLGREFVRAELALDQGGEYVQD